MGIVEEKMEATMYWSVIPPCCAGSDQRQHGLGKQRASWLLQTVSPPQMKVRFPVCFQRGNPLGNSRETFRAHTQTPPEKIYESRPITSYMGPCW